MHAEVARLDHFGLAPIKLPVLQQVALEPDRLRHGNLVLLPRAAEEHGAHILSSHDWEFDPQRIANWRGLEEVYAGANGKPLDRPDTKLKLAFSLMSCWEERTNEEHTGPGSRIKGSDLNFCKPSVCIILIYVKLILLKPKIINSFFAYNFPEAAAVRSPKEYLYR